MKNSHETSFKKSLILLLILVILAFLINSMRTKATTISATESKPAAKFLTTPVRLPENQKN